MEAGCSSDKAQEGCIQDKGGCFLGKLLNILN